MNYSPPHKRPPESRNAAPPNPGHCEMSTKAGTLQSPARPAASSTAEAARPGGVISSGEQAPASSSSGSSGGSRSGSTSIAGSLLSSNSLGKTAFLSGRAAGRAHTRLGQRPDSSQALPTQRIGQTRVTSYVRSRRAGSLAEQPSSARAGGSAPSPQANSRSDTSRAAASYSGPRSKASTPSSPSSPPRPPTPHQHVRDRRRHGRGAAGGGRRQPRPAPLRGRLLDALRLLTDPRLFRPDAPPPT
jgi:hypothetical protein